MPLVSPGHEEHSSSDSDDGDSGEPQPVRRAAVGPRSTSGRVRSGAFYDTTRPRIGADGIVKLVCHTQTQRG